MKTMNTLKLINRALLAGIVTLTLGLAVCLPASAGDSVSIGKEKLANALRSATGARGAALKSELARLIEGATESKTSAPILERE